MQWRKLLVSSVAALALTVGLAVNPAPANAHHIDNCTEGQWNFRQAVNGGCAYGYITYNSSYTGIDINVTVHDLYPGDNATWLSICWFYNGQVQFCDDEGYVDHGVRPVQQTRWFNGYDMKVSVCNSQYGCSSGVWYWSPAPTGVEK